MDYVRTRKPLPVLGPETPAAADEPPLTDRRTFLSETARLAAITVLVSACGSGFGTTLLGPGNSTLDKAVTVKLSDYPGLAKTGSAVRINGVSLPMALVNQGNNVYTAVSLVCTHQGGIVQWTGAEFVCPIHGARFADDG